MKQITVYQVNHSSFQTIPVWGAYDLVVYTAMASGFVQSTETAIQWLMENNYEVMPHTVHI